MLPAASSVVLDSSPLWIVWENDRWSSSRRVIQLLNERCKDVSRIQVRKRWWRVIVHPHLPVLRPFPRPISLPHDRSPVWSVGLCSPAHSLHLFTLFLICLFQFLFCPYIDLELNFCFGISLTPCSSALFKAQWKVVSPFLISLELLSPSPTLCPIVTRRLFSKLNQSFLVLLLVPCPEISCPSLYFHFLGPLGSSVF